MHPWQSCYAIAHFLIKLTGTDSRVCLIYELFQTMRSSLLEARRIQDRDQPIPVWFYFYLDKKERRGSIRQRSVKKARPAPYVHCASVGR